MAAVCGVCGEVCNEDKSITKCCVCENYFHIKCVKTDGIKTRAGNKDWKCEQCSKSKTSSVSNVKPTSHDTPVTREFMETFKNEIFLLMKKQSTDMEEFKNTIEFLSNSVDNSNALMADIRKEYAEIRKENNELRIKNEQLSETVSQLNIRVRELEQYSRRTNIEINGIPTTNNEDIMSLVRDVGAAVGQDLQVSHIMAAHRVPSFNKQRTPSIVVQFQTRTQRDSWIAGFRQKKNLVASEINKVFSQNKVYISEHLTQENKRLLSELKQKCREMGIKFVWCRDGRFYVRKCEGERAYRITNIGDLKNVR